MQTLTIGLVPLLLAGSLHAEEETPDVVVLESGKRLEGVVLERFDPDFIVFLKKTRRKEIKRKDIVSLDVKRDRLSSLMRSVVPNMDAGARWALVGRAVEQRLPRFARVLAYHVLVVDNDHAEAHAFLGHEKKRDTWRWALGRKAFEKDEFDALMCDWKTHFVLESEHYTVETNSSLKQAVEIVFDLERLYLFWMGTLGQVTQAAEDVARPQFRRMTAYIYRRKEDRGYKMSRTPRREPICDMTSERTTPKDNPNVFMTYYEDDEPRPLMLFELGARQLMYSLLVMAKNRGELLTAFKDTSAHWVEWGLGYWVANRLDHGPPGFAQPHSFAMDPSIAVTALETPAKGPLRHIKEELTNLIGLPTAWFYDRGRISDIHRAKAMAFTAFLLETNAPVKRRREVQGHTRQGLFSYLREVYGTPKGHSSSAFDAGIGKAKVESLGDPWRQWMRELSR